MADASVLRIVQVRFREGERTPGSRQAVAAEARRVFPTIPGVVSFEAGVPADDEAAGRTDVVLVVGFRDVADVAAYRVHPIHVAFVEEHLKPRMTELVAVNVKVGAGA